MTISRSRDGQVVLEANARAGLGRKRCQQKKVSGTFFGNSRKCPIFRKFQKKVPDTFFPRGILCAGLLRTYGSVALLIFRMGRVAANLSGTETSSDADDRISMSLVNRSRSRSASV